ncbi:MAG: hypothetical protein PUE85_08455 [Firmicutes bacterium]|nr:hypothetical protein [Bacillota bacterium]
MAILFSKFFEFFSPFYTRAATELITEQVLREIDLCIGTKDGKVDYYRQISE